MKTKSFMGAVLIVVVVIIGCYFIHTNYGEREKEYNCNTPKEAITAYLVSEDRYGDDIDNMIMANQNCGDDTYYLLKSKYMYNEENSNFSKEINYVFVVIVKQHKGKYICYRITNDFSLDSPQSINDIDYTPYIQFIIPTDKDNLFFVAGKIFDTRYSPVYKGKPISLDNDNLFYLVVSDSKPDIKFVKE